MARGRGRIGVYKAMHSGLLSLYAGDELTTTPTAARDGKRRGRSDNVHGGFWGRSQTRFGRKSSETAYGDSSFRPWQVQCDSNHSDAEPHTHLVLEIRGEHVRGFSIL